MPHPDRFDPDRQVEHLTFSGGIHYCFGAALARLEAQIALSQLANRLHNPRLVTDHLVGALRLALDDPVPGYAERAREALAQWRPEAVDRVVAEQLLPRLQSLA